MSRQLYLETIERFAALIGLGPQEAKQLAEGGALDTGGVAFSLVHGGKEVPHLLLVYGDFGEVPRGREAAIYHALLETNLAMYTGSSPQFGISPYTKRVLLALSYPLDGLDVERLRASLDEIAELARQWRTHYFLEPPNARTAPPANKTIPAAG